jgi:hypothetical protein
VWLEAKVWCPRLTAAMILSGSVVQVKDFGLSLVSRRERLMAAWSSTIDRTVTFETAPGQLGEEPSTALSQEPEVGV